MALVFPTSPTTGATYTDPATGRTWAWDGAKWVPAAAGGAYLPISGGSLTGLLTAPQVNAPIITASQAITGPDPPAGDNSQLLATTEWINANARYGDNRIINGDMRIDQRNNGASGTASVYTVDRWAYNASQANKGTWQRFGPGSPVITGFPYNLGFTSSSAYASLASDVFSFSQMIEGDAISDFAWGTVSALPATLSFWANSSLTGTFGGGVSNAVGTRTYPFGYSLPVANTWTKIVIPIPADTAGTWVMNGNAASLQVNFDLGIGSAYRGPAGAWTNTNYASVVGAASVVGTNGATFYVTGVKLEIGSVATPFNRQSLAKSLADCQRYYQTGDWQIGGYSLQGINNINCCSLPVVMRVTPTTGYDLKFGTANIATAAPNAISPAALQTSATVVALGGYLGGGGYWLDAEL